MAVSAIRIQVIHSHNNLLLCEQFFFRSFARHNFPFFSVWFRCCMRFIFSCRCTRQAVATSNCLPVVDLLQLHWNYCVINDLNAVENEPIRNWSHIFMWPCNNFELLFLLLFLSYWLIWSFVLYVSETKAKIQLPFVVVERKSFSGIPFAANIVENEFNLKLNSYLSFVQWSSTRLVSVSQYFPNYTWTLVVFSSLSFSGKLCLFFIAYFLVIKCNLVAIIDFYFVRTWVCWRCLGSFVLIQFGNNLFHFNLHRFTRIRSATKNKFNDILRGKNSTTKIGHRFSFVASHLANVVAHFLLLFWCNQKRKRFVFKLISGLFDVR